MAGSSTRFDRLGYGDNTLIFYIWGDNGSSGEGQNGTISELLAQNGIPTTIDMHLRALDELGGLDVLGSPKVDNQYHAGWAWAGSTPYQGMRALLASHLGGTRNPMAIRWPAKITPDPVPRTQFHHCNDIVPTLYEILGITAPRVVNGIPQDPIDGVSFAYTFDDPSAAGRLAGVEQAAGSRGRTLPTAAILAAGLAGLTVTGLSPFSATWLAYTSVAALMCGALLLLARVLKLGFIGDFLSASVLIGFLTGVGIQVLCGSSGRCWPSRPPASCSRSSSSCVASTSRPTSWWAGPRRGRPSTSRLLSGAVVGRFGRLHARQGRTSGSRRPIRSCWRR